MKSIPFVMVFTLGLLGATYVVEGGQYSCRWTIVGYVCPDLSVSAR